MARLRVAASLLIVLASCAVGQNPPQSDPQAINLATQSIAAMTGGIAISDVTLSGAATWIAGADTETGSATLMAKGVGESRVDLSLTAGSRSEIRNDLGDGPEGASIANGGAQTLWALHNCWTNPSWFFPALSILSSTSDPALVWSYIGQEVRNGSNVEHIRVYRYGVGETANATALLEQVSSVDYFLDSSLMLPVAEVFNTHPDDNAGVNILTEIDFSNFQTVNGIKMPFHIQKLVSGGLALDVSVTGAVLNSGLPDTLFAINE